MVPKYLQSQNLAGQELTNTVDRAFVFVMISVGIGVGGIIIGAYALSRKGERPADFGRK
jgi:hypothetical protein